MRLVPLKLMEANINHHFQIAAGTQDIIRIGIAQYIVDLGKALNL